MLTAPATRDRSRVTAGGNKDDKDNREDRHVGGRRDARRHAVRGRLRRRAAPAGAAPGAGRRGRARRRGPPGRRRPRPALSRGVHGHRVSRRGRGPAGHRGPGRGRGARPRTGRTAAASGRRGRPVRHQAVTGAFQAEAAAAGQHLTVTDIRPLPPGDQTRIAPPFAFLGLALPGAVFGIMLAGVVGKRLNGPAKLASLVGFAILTALAATWITDGMTGALPGNPAGLIGIVALTAFAVSTA